MKLYNAQERAEYKSPPCPECGGPTITTRNDSGGIADPPDLKWPGTRRCANPTAHEGFRRGR